MSANKNPHARTSQEMDNLSFDDTYSQNTQELLGYDGSALQRVKTDSSGNLQVGVVNSYDTTEVDTTDPDNIVVTKKLAGATVDTKKISII